MTLKPTQNCGQLPLVLVIVLENIVKMQSARKFNSELATFLEHIVIMKTEGIMIMLKICPACEPKR